MECCPKVKIHCLDIFKCAALTVCNRDEAFHMLIPFDVNVFDDIDEISYEREV